MNGEFDRAFKTVLRFGSVTDVSVPLRTGSPKLVEPMRFCTPGLSMYARNCAHCGSGAFAEQAKPSPPPSSEPGVALLPGTFGNANQPRKLGTFWSGVSGCMTPAFQCPCSSMATLPFASRPAELVGTCCAGVARKPSWKGFASRSCCTYAPALSQHGSLKL